MCPQLPSRLEAVMGPLTNGHDMDKDCLHLSIIAPQNATQAPVIVWLHGGAYISRSGDLTCYQRCVAVDQENIAAFGGNPKNITLVGQSAGADSIICLMAAENTAATGPLVTKLAEKLFTKDPRAMSVDELLGVQKKLLMDPVQKQVMPFAPNLGLDPLPKEVEFDQKIDEVVRNIPILIGWTAHDGRPFSSMMGPQSLLQLPVIGPYVEALGTWYITRSYFKWPSLRFHEQTLRAGGKSTSYSFEWAADENVLGACHCIDIPFVLGGWNAWKTAPMLTGKNTQEDIARLGSDLKDMCTNLMNGNPVKAGHIEITKTIR